MKESEAIENLKCYRAQSGTSYPEEIEMAIKALEEVQKYKTLEQRVKDRLDNKLSLTDVVDSLDRVWGQMVEEPDNPLPMNVRILTYKESADWDEYRSIGTVEECRAAVEKQKAKSVIFDTPLRVLECPMCGNYVQTVQDDEGCTNGTIPKYCKNCGQKLNWGDEE